ncbi:hypothetical protein [Anaerocolumna chitinilytica]|uniref:DUF5050 domain-containing protein n=1 Tax=Anaerocolumna chitinilytica TaxID=1727145 RepID=A0A7I8DQW6_9FIRM|nr:hypothetical protein [Anaerocolumna chitinilytica]BCK00673.1 hypothetical protein bsdcttw_37130 [Anaerocolumna chitinilytica]
MRKHKQKLFVCILIILLTLQSINSHPAIAFSAEENTSSSNTLVSPNYKEKEIPFKHKGDLCENGPWELNKNSSGMIYAYEWDTYYKVSASDSYWVGLYKMMWSDDGKLSYQAIRLNSKFSKRISSGDNIWATKQDKNSNLFVAYMGTYDGKSDVPMLTVLNKKGTVLKDFVLDDVLKYYISDSSISIRDIHITGSTVALLVSENYGSQTSVQLYNWKTKKRLSTQKLSKMSYISFIGNYLYSVKSSDSANTSSNTTDSDSKKYQLIKYSLDGKKILWSQNLPKGELNIDSAYNKFSYDTVGDTIYVCNREGIYSVDTSKENSTFSLLMSANQSQYLSKYYTIVDFRVISKDCFYLLSIAGEDEEWPTNLAVYTRN